MDKQQLLDSAAQLQQPDTSIAAAYAAKADVFTAMLNERLLGREDVQALVGNQMDMMKDNHANHVRFMISIFQDYKPEVLVDTVLWVFRAYRSHGFTSNYWAAQMNIWLEILKAELTSEIYDGIAPFYKWMQVNIPLFVILSDEELDAHHSQH